jgi:hypothetical protein
MKPLNFTAKEVLPSLLDRSKTQTIRLAWKEQKWTEHFKEDSNSPMLNLIDNLKLPHYSNKPPRFKVGDEVKLFWNQRSKYKYFCSGKSDGNFGKEADQKYCYYCPYKVNKLLGTAKITEVFEIEMGLGTYKDREKYYIEYIGQEPKSQDYYNEFIAQNDGFETAEDMFFYFDDKYNLNGSPKKFYVYRWSWL